MRIGPWEVSWQGNATSRRIPKAKRRTRTGKRPGRDKQSTKIKRDKKDTSGAKIAEELQWAPNKLTLAGIPLNCELFPTKHGNAKGPIKNVLFKALAVDVACFPKGEDALDIMRCVLWSVHNIGSGLLYPRDFPWLTSQLGGPQPVTTANHDEAVFARWTRTVKDAKDNFSDLRSRLTEAERIAKSIDKSMSSKAYQRAVGGSLSA